MNILLTGGAGFIGSHIADALVQEVDVHQVRILDNLATGHIKNIAHLLDHPKVEFIEGDIRDFGVVQSAMKGITHVCHQAALGSVPRSIKDPLTTHAVNATGTLHVFEAARQGGVKRIVYAASSSTYGDSVELPKVEERIGSPLSPYAVTKAENEQYARVYGTTYGMEMIGLRYFNVFGPRQDPDGPYAAVIPLFIKKLMEGGAAVINGDGSYSRDFTYVANAVQVNLLALKTAGPESVNQVYNIACGERTTLLQLYENLCEISGKHIPPQFGPVRAGDIPHSHADIGKARKLLGYDPGLLVRDGLRETYLWYQGK
jgi:UDP-N-acetylglucosamine 4-epimerase